MNGTPNDNPAARGSRTVLVGQSPAICDALRDLDHIARSDGSVLLLGETGTGKDLLARIIHERSARRSGPFIPQNCAALPSELVESELFGHAPGAFSGAGQRSKPGLLELADGGTFFLDEIGELPLALQAKLLSVLEHRTVRRIGDTTARKIDFRIVTATNRDIRQEILQGRFRQDLLYRINVFTMTLPPLRERRSDIPILAAFFARRFALQARRSVPEFTDDAMTRLATATWPGNIRELSNVVERAVGLADSGPIEARHLALDTVIDPNTTGSSLRDEQRLLERKLAIQALRRSDGNVTAAARTLGIARQQLQRIIRRHQLGGTSSG